MKLHTQIKLCVVLLITFFCFVPLSYSQSGINSQPDVSASATITTEGISIVPALSLGEPAAIFNLSVGHRLTFEPDLRFSLEGEPWSFLFWFRYDFVDTEKFELNIGAHPEINFRTTNATINDAANEIIEARRFLAGELDASYMVAPDVTVGSYYLYGHGFEVSVPDNTHYLSFRSTLSEIYLFQDIFLTMSPELYYLKIDRDDGVYIASGMNLGKDNVPVSISAFYNQTIHSNISGSPVTLWNLSLTYSIRL